MGAPTRHSSLFLFLLLLFASCAAGTRFHGEALQAYGTFAHDVGGSSGLDDRTAALYSRLRFEGFAPSGFGVGASLEALQSDDDLIAGDGEFSASGLFLYGGYFLGEDPFQLTLRTGPVFWAQELDVDDLDLDEEWYALGWALEGTPKIRLTSKEEEFQLWAAGEFRLAVLDTAIDLDYGAVSEDYDALSYIWSLQVGLEGRVKAFHFSLGYLAMGFFVDETDWEKGTRLRETDDTFAGIALTGGFRF